MNNRLLHINILDHPSRSNKLVFFYIEKDHSDYFKLLLKEQNVPYEYQFDEAEKKYYFGVEKRFESPVKKLNYLVFAKYRKPFIASKMGQYLLLGLTFLFIILALIGYLKSGH